MARYRVFQRLLRVQRDERVCSSAGCSGARDAISEFANGVVML